MATSALQAPPSEVRLLRLPEVLRRTGMGRSWVYAAVKAGDFPSPIPCGARAIAWPEHEVNAWVMARIQSARATAD